MTCVETEKGRKNWSINDQITSSAWLENKGVKTIQWTKGAKIDFNPPKKRWLAAHLETDEGPHTVMDAHRRWATVKNERMGIVLEVTHTDDGGCKVRDEQKKEGIGRDV